jgi:hypothetical protein
MCWVCNIHNHAPTMVDWRVICVLNAQHTAHDGGRCFSSHCNRTTTERTNKQTNKRQYTATLCASATFACPTCVQRSTLVTSSHSRPLRMICGTMEGTAHRTIQICTHGFSSRRRRQERSWCSALARPTSLAPRHSRLSRQRWPVCSLSCGSIETSCDVRAPPTSRATV